MQHICRECTVGSRTGDIGVGGEQLLIGLQWVFTALEFNPPCRSGDCPVKQDQDQSVQLCLGCI